MFWAFVSLIVSAPLIVSGICCYLGRKEKKDKEREQIKERWLTANNAKVRYWDDNGKSYEFQIKKLTRMTLERFLNLYQVSPNKWYICEDNEVFTYYCPCYVQEEEKTDKRGKKTKEYTLIPIFWENPEELEKYTNWVKTKYKLGEAAYYQEKRDEYAKKLAEYIQKDLEEKRKQSLAELAAIEEQFKKDREESAKKKIELTLEPFEKRSPYYKCTQVNNMEELYRDAYQAKMSDIVYVKETGKSYAWNGTEWCELAPWSYVPSYASTTATQAVTFPPPVQRA